MDLLVQSLDELPEAARTIAGQFQPDSLVAFYGPMGVGKTTLIGEICRQAGVTDSVNSPTFSIVNQYGTPDGRCIYHFDFYRIGKTEEVFDFGYEEYFYSGNLCLIEWPEKIEEILPLDIVKVKMEAMDDGVRKITVSKNG